MKIKLYLNDPPGKRCNQIVNAVNILKEKYMLKIEIIKKSDVEAEQLDRVPKFPAIEINDEIHTEETGITVEELETIILKIKKDIGERYD